MSHHAPRAMIMRADTSRNDNAADDSSKSVSFEMGLAHHRAGRIQEAQAIYRRILECDPTHADSTHLLGIAAFQAGNYNSALDLVSKAIDLQPLNSVFHGNLGQILQAIGRKDLAILSYEKALEYKSDNLEARNQLGKLLGESGNVEAEEAYYRSVLNYAASNVDAHFNLANLLMRLNRLNDAVGEFRETLRLKPDFAAAHNNLGVILCDLSAFQEGERCYREALKRDPGFAAAHNNLGILLTKLGRTDEAEKSLREAYRLQPCFPEALNNLGDLLRICGRIEEAESCCREALRLKPDYPSAQLNLGNALRESGRFDEAEACYLKALERNPEWAEANNNLSSLLFDMGRPDEAIPRFRMAISKKPDYADAHTNLAITLLLAGRFEEGWREYEWRWKQDKNKPHVRNFGQPLWQGEDTGERVLLLHAEEGLGDTLQFCRFVPEIAAHHRVILEVQPPLMPLLMDLPGIERIVALGDPLPPFDLHCPLLSLPLVLGTRLETIPADVPYLRADRQRTEFWRQRVEKLDGLRVGLVWAGNQAMAADRRRSIPLERFAALANLPGVQFISLQKGPAAEQAPPAGFVLRDWTEDLADFRDTAALVAALDLVISVDTAVVHLAGALGRPVWLLNRYDRCWRWLLNRDDSPWYPTLRQFRQPRSGDWHSVFRQVRAALQGRANQFASSHPSDSGNAPSLSQGMN